jgi:phosphoribosylamine-glycine ligase
MNTMNAREQAYEEAERLTLLPEAEYEEVLAKETDENNHSFAVVSICAYMLAKGYPCEAEYGEALDILEEHEKQGSISEELLAARCEILHRLDKMTSYFSRFKKCF